MIESIRKPHMEFSKLDMSSGWEVPPGYPPGMKQKVLSSDLAEDSQAGSRTRLLKIEAGTFTTVPFIHDYWEEVYLLEGDLIVGNDNEGKGGEQFLPPVYACRPPGVYHGPFTTVNGCILFELHYYDPRN